MLYVVILAGGTGERFWPKSRKESPKQLLPVVGKKSMLQQTVERAKKLVSYERILIMANRTHIPTLAKQVTGVRVKNLIAEPFSRNTAAACGLAAIFIERENPDAVMAVLPADHVISSYEKFSSCVRLGAEVARKCEGLVTIGMKPTYPARGYGYIQLNPKPQTPNPKMKEKVFKVERFVEKPSKKMAEGFLRSDRYLWNSGIFVWKAKVILEAIEEYMPRLSSGLKKIGAAIGTDSYEQVLRRVYSSIRPVSIDYGIMERARNIFCLKANFIWDDVGSWVALERLYRPNKDGNVCIGVTECIDTKGSIILGRAEELVATIGIKDLVVVATEDAILVCDKGRSEDVKRLVESLGKKKKFRRYL